jgi:hypothetical protein
VQTEAGFKQQHRGGWVKIDISNLEGFKFIEFRVRGETLLNHDPRFVIKPASERKPWSLGGITDSSKPPKWPNEEYILKYKKLFCGNPKCDGEPYVKITNFMKDKQFEEDTEEQTEVGCKICGYRFHGGPRLPAKDSFHHKISAMEQWRNFSLAKAWDLAYYEKGERETRPLEPILEPIPMPPASYEETLEKFGLTEVDPETALKLFIEETKDIKLD